MLIWCPQAPFPVFTWLIKYIIPLEYTGVIEYIPNYMVT